MGCDITVIILTLNEEKNISYCIQSAKDIADRILVVDSGSKDNTVSIAKENGADVVFHEWEGHAKQFNWALDNCNIKTEWVFRLDADERISTELSNEIREKVLNAISEDINGFMMRWQIYFMGKRLHFGGTHKPYFLRLFRFGAGRVVERLMDENIVVEGKAKKLSADLIHYDYKDLDQWLKKHIWYTNLEYQSYYNNCEQDSKANKRQEQRRGFYYRLPLFFRAKLYYIYRYYFQFGFLDGRPGKIFIFLQAYWFRFVVDAKVYERENVLKCKK